MIDALLIPLILFSVLFAVGMVLICYGVEQYLNKRANRLDELKLDESEIE